MTRARFVKVKATGQLIPVIPAAPPFKPRDRKAGNKYVTSRKPPVA